MVEWGQLSSRKLEGGNASTVQLWLKVGSVGKAVMAGKVLWKEHVAHQHQKSQEPCTETAPAAATGAGWCSQPSHGRGVETKNQVKWTAV